MAGVRFGAFAPQGWKMELVGIPDAGDKWTKCRETALLAEQLGYDSIWVYDHFHNVPTPAHETVFECWTVMAALAAQEEDSDEDELIDDEVEEQLLEMLPSVRALLSSSLYG